MKLNSKEKYSICLWLAIAIAVVLLLTSCADSTKRQSYLKNIYPNCRVEPATGLMQRDGFDFIVIDSTLQIIAVNFYPFSEKKIMTLRNIR